MIHLGNPVYRFESVASTMDEVDRLARDGAPEGTAVITAHQEQGRGRAGRVWATTPGTSFLCSVLLRPNLLAREVSSLPLVAGVAIAEAIEAIGGVACQLKWPNDILVDGKKICGVLAQSRSLGERVEFINLGIGVNLNAAANELPETATSLAIELGHPVALESFENEVFIRLSSRYREFNDCRGRPSLDPWLQRALFRDETVEIQQGDTTISGTFAGIEIDGALRLETEHGIQSIAIGELTRGPRSG